MRRLVGMAATGLVAMVAATGCGGLGQPEPEPEPPAAQLRTTLTYLAETPTLRGVYTVDIVSFPQGRLTGEVDVVAGSAMALTFDYWATVGEISEEVDGQVRAIGREAFLQSSQYSPPDGKEWFAASRDPRPRIGEPNVPEWHPLALSRLFDPLFLLTGGLPEVTGLTATPETVDGAATIRYEGQWMFSVDGAGPELTEWAENVMHATVLDLSFWVTDQGQPIKAALSSSAVVYFRMEISYSDHGAPLTVEAPPEDLVAAT